MKLALSYASVSVFVLALLFPACGEHEAAPGVRVGTWMRSYRMKGDQEWTTAPSGNAIVQEIQGTRALLKGSSYSVWVDFAEVTEYRMR